MKKTITITLNGMVFNIEEDAYDRLNSYLEGLKHHFGTAEYGKEVVNDIESRIAEQLSAKMNDRRKEVIILAEVEDIIKSMGSVEDLDSEDKKQAHDKDAVHRLYRNPDDQIISGVSSGIASYFNIDPIIPRLVFVVLALAGGWGILLYILLWIIVPEAKTNAEKLEMKGNPVNLANLEESRKEKNNPRPKFSIIRFFLQEIVFLIGRFFRALGPIVLKIAGLFLTAGAFVAAFAITMLALILLFNPNSTYVDPLISQIFSGHHYFTIIATAYIAALIPALTVLMIGVSFVRRKSVFNTRLILSFVTIWLIGSLAFGIMASQAAPQIQAAVERIEEQPSQSKIYEVPEFNSVQAVHDQKIKILKGNEQKVVVYAQDDELDDLQLVVRNRTLLVDQESKDFEICLICIHKPVTVEITMPELNLIDANHSSNVEIIGFDNADSVRLEASGAAEVSFEGSAENLNIVALHASDISITGNAKKLKAVISNASHLNAGGFLAEDAEIIANHSSQATVNASKKLKATGSGASRIYYSGNPVETAFEDFNAATIQER